LLLHSWPPVSFSLTDLIPFPSFFSQLQFTSSFIYFFTQKRYLLYVKNIYWSGGSSSNNNKKLSHYSIKTNDILKKKIYGLTMNKKRFYRPSLLFGSVIAIIFQNTFHAEIYRNDIFFLFFKNYFWDQHIKTIQNIKKN
jgi:hypothetical protein